MKVFILLILFSITNLSMSGNLLEFGAAIVSKTLKCQLTRNLNLDVSEIVVYFYDFQNHVFRSFPVDKAAQGILSLNKLNTANKFFMYVGGFKSHIKKKSTERVRNVFRNIQNSYLIIIDHSAYTNDKDGYKKSYERSVKYVPHIGRKLAQMLAGLQKGGVSAKTIRCIGHSLGGQMLGYVGENFIKATGRKISRITALDPAGPCFDKSNQDHVRSGVAEYVEVYHCNAGILGSSKSLADVDFFANNGQSQTNCGEPSSVSISNSLTASKCSHKMCTMMWTASVMHRNWYTAYKCPKYKYFKIGRCSQNEKTTAGFWNPGTATGTFYFTTDGYDFN